MPEGHGTLSERHKECLRLVAQGMTSKEIGQELRLSPSTVDTYIKDAMARLNANSRRDAARQFLSKIPQQLGSQPPPLVDARNGVQSSRQRLWPLRWIFQQLPPLGGKQNDLGWLQRNQAIFAIAAFCFAVLIAIVLVTTALFKVFA